MTVFVCGSRCCKGLKPLVEDSVGRDLAQVSTRGFIPLLWGEVCGEFQ